MHTFVINTSTVETKRRNDKFDKLLDGIFEIPKIKKDLSILDCPVDTWNSKDCVFRMCEMIDSYREITGNFNLIIYADLYAYEKDLVKPGIKERDRDICIGALRLLFRRYFISTLLDRLDKEVGLVPVQVLLIFDENTEPSDRVPDKDERERLIVRKVTEYIGISPYVWDHTRDAEVHIAGGILPEAAGCYDSELKTWKETASDPARSASADEALFKIIEELGVKDEKKLPTVIRRKNRIACGNNTSLAKKMTLELYLFILDCVRSGTLYSDEKERTPKEFVEVHWNELTEALARKQKEYDLAYIETVNLTKSFVDLGMAPKLRRLDNQRFGLSEAGGPLIEREEVRETEDASKKRKKKKKGDISGEDGNAHDEADEGKLPRRAATRLREKETEYPNLFDSDEYVTFEDFYKIQDLSLLKMGTDPEKYKEKAKQVRDHHEEYLTDKLKSHIQKILSRYSAPSIDHDPAILGKRKVSITNSDFEKESDGRRYAASGEYDTRRSADLSELADKAYDTVEKRFFAFNAGRPVAVTNIDEECDRFLTRIDDITDSLRDLKITALASLAALLVLYVPFLVIQWNAITENAGTRLIALASVGIPLAILGVIIVILGQIQKRKYIEAWKEFKKNSDEILAENDRAVRQFDELLSNVIPSLRWIFDYKLDVEFYKDCCRIAASKLEHHKKKLFQRAEDTMNILQDLDYDPGRSTVIFASERRRPDYSVAFCDSEKNRDFYSIVDDGVLDAALGRKE